jgi:plastocyanin
MSKILLVCIYSCLFWGTIAKATDYKIKIVSMKFVPKNLTVKVGDKITWINQDIGVHNVASRSFTSGSLRPKKKWSLHVTEEGEFPYKCLFHSGMKGLIIVKTQK